MRLSLKRKIFSVKISIAVNAQIRGKILKLVKTLKLKISPSPQAPLQRHAHFPSNCWPQRHCEYLSSFPSQFATVFYRNCSKKKVFSQSSNTFGVGVCMCVNVSVFRKSANCTFRCSQLSFRIAFAAVLPKCVRFLVIL